MLKALDAEDSWRVQRQRHWLKLKRGGYGGAAWGGGGAEAEAGPPSTSGGAGSADATGPSAARSGGEAFLADTLDVVLLGAGCNSSPGAVAALTSPSPRCFRRVLRKRPA